MSSLYSKTNDLSIGLIERLIEAMGATLVGNNFSPILSKISFHMKRKSDSSRPEIYKALNPCCKHGVLTMHTAQCAERQGVRTAPHTEVCGEL